MSTLENQKQNIKTNRKRTRKEIDDGTQLRMANPPNKRRKLNDQHENCQINQEIAFSGKILKFDPLSNTYCVQLTNNPSGLKILNTTETTCTVDIDAKYINAMLYTNQHEFVIVDNERDSEVALDFDELQMYIQEKSSNDLDEYLNNMTVKKIAKDMAIIISGLALCQETVCGYKAKINESPFKTIAVMQKWNILYFNDANTRHIGREWLYCGIFQSISEEWAFEVIEYLLCRVESIQFFDSRSVDILFFDAQNDDEIIGMGVVKFNKMRTDKKKAMVSLFQDNIENLPNPIIHIITKYCLAPYNFHYDENDYTSDGDYKQI